MDQDYQRMQDSLGERTPNNGILTAVTKKMKDYMVKESNKFSSTYKNYNNQRWIFN